MKTFASLMLLVSVFVVSFVNRSYIGLPLYFGLFALMPLWVWMFYAGGYRITPERVRKVRKEPFDCSFMATRTNRLQGQTEYGRLIVTPNTVDFYVRSKHRHVPCELAWTIPVSRLRSFALEKGDMGRYTLTFMTDDGEVTFGLRKMEDGKEVLMKALGWDQVPGYGPVSVSGEAADAPSFDEAVRQAGNKRSQDI